MHHKGARLILLLQQFHEKNEKNIACELMSEQSERDAV